MTPTTVLHPLTAFDRFMDQARYRSRSWIRTLATCIHFALVKGSKQANMASAYFPLALSLDDVIALCDVTLLPGQCHTAR